MGDPPGPLHRAAAFLYSAGEIFATLAFDINKVPIIGEYLAAPFTWVDWFLYWTAYWLDEADTWINSFNIGTLYSNLIDWVMDAIETEPYIRMFYQDHFVAWIMHRLGFYTADCFDFDASPEAFILWKITSWFPDLAFIWEDPFGWIKEKIVERVPGLGYLFEDPAGWVLYMLGVPWFERIFWADHLLAWLLHRWGLSTADALMFEADPIEWVRYQVLKRWDFLDDLLLDPVGWFWKEFIEAVDRYIDVNIDWLVTTAARVLNTIWQTRI